MKLINGTKIDNEKVSIAESDVNQYRTSAQISNGEITIDRIIYFESESKNEDATTITSLPQFPQKMSAHPKNANFKYYGNGSVEPIDSEGKYWRAVLQYSTSNPNATDKSGKPVTSETDPTTLRPDRVTFSYPETTIPFDIAYSDKGELNVQVQNSAGDPIPANRSVRNAQMSFTFATSSWSPNYGIVYGETLNSTASTVCGISIKANQGLLLPPEASFITVYNDDGTVKWKYWSVDVTILFDIHGTLFNRTFLDVGDRAKFAALTLTDDLLTDAGRTSGVAIPETKNPSQICRFRKCKKFTASGKSSYLPIGDNVFCSWEQYIAARQAYLDASSALVAQGKLESIYELQCEQERQMPLSSASGTVGQIDTAALTSKQYGKKQYLQYPSMSWSSLNLPTSI